MPFKITSRLSTSWLENKLKSMGKASLEMATDIHRQASLLAPVLSGNLVASGRIEKVTGGYEVAFGGSSGFNVPYAKRRHFENKKSPQTLRYLERAGDNVSRDKAKYLKGK